MQSNHLILCRPLFLMPSVFTSIRVFSNESVLYIREPEYWSFSFSISLSSGCSGLISFRIVWFNLLEVQETLKSLPQHHSSKVLILQYLAFLMVQPSHPYVTTGKTIALTRWTFVRKIMPLILNMLSRFVIVFLPRSKNLLISWLWSPLAVILELKKIKFVTVSIFPQLFAMKWWDWMPWSSARSQHTRSHPWQGHEEKTWQARQIRIPGISKKPAHEIPPMTRSWGENLMSKADQDPRDFEKLPPALTLKVVSVFLVLALIDYSLISVTQAEGLPRSLST